MGMKITSINLKPYNKGNMRAYVDITFEGKLSIKQCKLLQGKNGYFIGYPSNQKGDKYYPYVKISEEANEFKNSILSEVLKEYNKTAKEIESQPEEDVNEVI